MPGMVIRYEVEEGASVQKGDTVVIFEAMKMQSTLPAPVDGVIKQLSLAPGSKAAKGTVLAIIG